MSERITLSNDLITQKYTCIQHEKEIEYNAPHHFIVKKMDGGTLLTVVDFQKGPIKECGVNGCANEDLIAMVICRLESFQNSPYKCDDNQKAIECLQDSLRWLRKRTTERETRNVEGTNII